MKQKKQFNIPKNYEKKFEWVPGVSGLQTFVFIPVLGIDYFILTQTPLAWDNKVIFTVLATGIPWTLLSHKPLRENVSLFTHLIYRIKFLARQKVFHYKKEGYVHEFKQTIQVEDKGRKAARTSYKNNPGVNTIKINEKRQVHDS